MPEVIVVGGGVIGLMTARRLFEEGADVLLLEKGCLGGESSWAGGGIISPLYPWNYNDAVNVLAERSKQIYPRLVEQMFEECATDSELLTSGLLTVTQGPEEALAWAKKWSVKAEYIDDVSAIRGIEPMAGDAVSQAIWMPDIMQVRNPKLVKALKASFEHHKIAYRENVEVEDITVENGRVAGVRCDGRQISADKVIIASGAWSARFTATSNIDVSPVKGQMIMYSGEPGLLQRIVLSAGHYVIPRKDGRILAGSTLEKIGFDKHVSGEAQQELQSAAIELMPALADLTIERQWAGLRPGTEKGIPYICAHDEVEGLYIHAGHFRNGIVLGAASVEVMTDIVMGRKPFCDAAPYRMDAVH